MATIATRCATPKKGAAEMEYAMLVESANALTDSQGMIAASVTMDTVRRAAKIALGRARALVMEGALGMANASASQVSPVVIAQPVPPDYTDRIATSSVTLSRRATAMGGARMLENACATRALLDHHAIHARRRRTGISAGTVVMRRRHAAETVAAPMRVSVTALMDIRGTGARCASMLGLEKTVNSPATTKRIVLGVDGAQAMAPASVLGGTLERTVRYVSMVC